jgi:frataxin
MDQSVFDRLATETIDRLMQEIEDQLEEHLDVDLEAGILHIELQDGGRYVINKHGPNREIWLSSPVSGAWHFTKDEGGGWRSTRAVEGAHKELHDILAAELSMATGHKLDLTH